MYSNNFVLAVKVGGKVLREFNNSVYLPFGSEYSILLKNLSTLRAKVQVFIDGTDALDGNTIIVEPKSDVDLKRFIKNGNLNAGNSFKFIEKTAKVSKCRGDKAEDGLLTIYYEFETPNQIAWYSGRLQGGHEYISPSDSPYKQLYPKVTSGTTLRGVVSSSNSLYSTSGGDHIQYISSTLTTSSDAPPVMTQANTVGITAPGSVNEQKFTTASPFYGNGTKHTMTLQLFGGTPDDKVVEKPVTVTRLRRCSMCGTNVRQTAKFCHECGSSVEIV